MIYKTDNLSKSKQGKTEAFVEETVIQTFKKRRTAYHGRGIRDHRPLLCSMLQSLPGDNVFGFITLNDGIKIHRVNCPNAVQLMSKYSYRIVQTSWSSKLKTAFLAHVQLRGIDGMVW